MRNGLFPGMALFVLLSAGTVMAAPLADPAEEARAQALFRELRCLVCQNQSIVDSNAPLAEDLRTLVRERIEARDSDEEIKRFLVARYGEFILLRPRLTWETLLLWGAPVFALVGGLALSARAMRRRRHLSGRQMGLSEDEEERLKALLGRDEGPIS
ncbi:cytochrome c-type biogenesis protein CcmH [Agaricicola taiwanensis]|uniref:Cytochrome c-type biogenesis protein n=1 Tax=Agaricicola taiwanensis TaxID=591372 RepID=A0A8J2VSA9_9RHOB|nr:cytochrome c-type biogenesis protein [Agaricicola taiwanensis]GGE37118.1 cytochrome c-type biogenesis protein CcmH [Agaricicola taiwanensis]